MLFSNTIIQIRSINHIKSR